MIVSQSSKKDSDSRALSMRDATLYRRLVAKLNCLAMDRPDIRYAASTMGSQASSPKDADMARLKRVGRFMIGRPITWTHYRWGVRPDRIMAYTDSDWAAKPRRQVRGRCKRQRFHCPPWRCAARSKGLSIANSAIPSSVEEAHIGMRTWSDSKEWGDLCLGDQSPGRTIDGSATRQNHGIHGQ